VLWVYLGRLEIINLLLAVTIHQWLTSKRSYS
jgi:hypothetical protein